MSRRPLTRAKFPRRQLQRQDPRMVQILNDIRVWPVSLNKKRLPDPLLGATPPPALILANNLPSEHYPLSLTQL